MSSPYAERYGHTVTISVTERQFASLQEYCIKNRVSISAAFREAFFTLHPMDSTNENENDTLAKVWRPQRTYHVNPERSILSPLL